MYHKFLLIFITISLLPLITADKVGVVIGFPDGSIHAECIQESKDTNAYDLLNKLSLSTLWAGPSTFGHSLCKINNIGDDISGSSCSYSGKYWRFLSGINNKWEYMPVGFDGGNECWNGDLNSFNGHYCVDDKDIIGASYGEFGDPLPNFYTFDQICVPLKMDLKVYVNEKKQNGVNENGGNIEAHPGSEIKFEIEMENNYLFNKELNIEDITARIKIENINAGEDLEKKANFKDLKVNSKDDNTISFTVPLILEKDEYNVELEINGRTSTGIKQEILVDYDLEINKEEHNLIFSKIELENSESCPNEENKLLIELTNIGKKDESVLLSIKNQALGINFSDNFNLKFEEYETTYKRDMEFIIPELDPGDYEIDVGLDYSEKTKESVILTVKNCGSQSIINLATKQPAQIQNSKSFLQINTVPILLGTFLFFLITIIVYISRIL